MSDDTFIALIAEGSDEECKAALKRLRLDSLPTEEVLVDVLYSSLNYKDGLALKGGKIIRKFPMICGVDLADHVLESSSPEFSKGTEYSQSVKDLVKLDGEVSGNVQAYPLTLYFTCVRNSL